MSREYNKTTNPSKSSNMRKCGRASNPKWKSGEKVRVMEMTKSRKSNSSPPLEKEKRKTMDAGDGNGKLTSLC